MKANDLASLASVGLGVALLLWLLAAGLFAKRRAFPDGNDGDARAEPDTTPLRFRPDPRYFIGLWLVIFALGTARSFYGGLILGAFGALALALAYARSGVEIGADSVVFGTLAPVTVALEKIGAVVAAPRGAIGKSFGVYGVADRDGNWLAAIRYNTVIGGPRAAAEIIVRAGLETNGRGRWSRSGVDVPRVPLPFLGA